MTFDPSIDPTLDLVLEREIDIRPELVWRAWTEPEHLKQWFCPRPWTTVECQIDLRPGGIFATTMCSPDGKVQEPGIGCYLDVVEHRRLIWTDALLPGYRPAGKGFMTGILLLEPHGAGTKYTAIARHGDPATRKQHEDMGFVHGWSLALDQLVELMKEVR